MLDKHNKVLYNDNVDKINESCFIPLVERTCQNASVDRNTQQ